VLLDKYGVDSEGIFERIRDDIRESPLFRFDWFFLSRTPIEISRRCTTLLTTVAREFEDAAAPKGANGTANGKGKREPEDDENDEDSVLGMAPAKKKSKNSVKVCLIANLDYQITNHPLE
jgi:SWI/SNF-related matrix-associated actin-dependent regulator of chromatin subfamily A member 5